MADLHVRDLVSTHGDELELVSIGEDAGLANVVTVSHVQKPGLAMAGFLNHVVPERLQVFGRTEINYLAQLEPKRVRETLGAYFGFKVCGVIVTRNLTPSEDFLALAAEHQTPVLRTRYSSQEFTERVSRILEAHFARRTTMHGVLMDVYGVGVLLLGKSSIGKSECALDLILQGHRLVADDIVELQRTAQGTINGRSSEITKYYMEIRGLGIINIKEMFGIGSIRDRKKVHLVVRLVDWDEDTEYDRMGLDEANYNILGVELPMVKIPVRPGRNLTAIVEVAARNHLLKLEGYHAAQEFQKRLMERIADADMDLDLDIEESE
ncbi:MAG: HPr(Ser) kinase/phosphatase [Deltaproteobacteria bacterium]|nr:HPr(Ser) kinase/phosphatase [Deltaproteobacteria bacterium]MCB9478786.1 HPr(Ser) kinase/phosphatase [Deltaproteobacteria bacterium]MCB9489052.1 HPr(Ser) kinase/phosphatase [Deltaproteobacteria bacterium]